MAYALAVSAVFFALHIYEGQRNDSNLFSLFSINNNKLAFALAATSPSSPPILGNPPILSVPGDNYVEATSSSGTRVDFIVTATAGPPNSGTVDMDTQRQQQQLRQIPLSPVCSSPSGSLFPIGVTTVICSVSDSYNPNSNGGGGSSSDSINSNGKPVTKSFKIEVGDTTSPALSLPADGLSVKATSKTTAVSYSKYLAALDVVDGRIIPVCSPPSGSLFPIGTTMVSCSAIDKQGNTATGTFSITVRYPVFGGFVGPVDSGGSSVFKIGSTIPIKFQLIWPDGQTVTDARVQIFNAKISDDIIGSESGESGSISKEKDVVSPTPGNYFGYDSSTGLYTFYLGTGNLSPGIWQIKVVLDDGSSHALKISLVN